MIALSDAIRSLRPGANFAITGGLYDGLTWLSPDIPQPSEADVIAEQARLQVEWDAAEYQRKRAEEYPSLDAILVALWEASIEGRPESATELESLRQAIKQKYPKPGAP